jgi:inorganic pyrophosphatase
MNNGFWEYLQQLVDTSQIVVERPKGSIHPRSPGNSYPVDYGFLSDITSIDGNGVDVWVGTLGERKVVGVLCTVDLLKRDTELKLLLNCVDDEILGK